MVLPDVVEAVDGLVGVASCVLAVSRLICLSLTPAKFSVLANFWALSEALVISPDRPGERFDGPLPATLCAMPVMMTPVSRRSRWRPLPAFDAGGVASGFRCCRTLMSDGLADALLLALGNDLHERGAYPGLALCLPDGGARCGRVCV